MADINVADAIRARAEMALAKARRHEAVQKLLAHPVIEPLRGGLNDPVVRAVLAGTILAILFILCTSSSFHRSTSSHLADTSLSHGQEGAARSRPDGPPRRTY